MRRSYHLAYLAYRRLLGLLRPVTVGVRVLLVRDGRVLLVRHSYLERWFPPGGGPARGETLEEAARRECREEVGAELGELRLLGLHSVELAGRTDHIATFLCRDFRVPEPPRPASWEIKEVRWFPLDALPEDLPEGTRRRLEALLGEEYPP